MGFKLTASHQLPYGATSIGIVSSSSRADAVPKYSVFSDPGAKGIDVARAFFRCGALFRRVDDEVARARSNSRRTAPTMAIQGVTLTDGTKDTPEQSMLVEKAVRIHRLGDLFSRQDERFIESVLERGRFNESDIDRFGRDERVWRNIHTPQDLVFTSMQNLLRDAEQFPTSFTTDDIIEAYTHGYRAEHANRYVDLYPQYNDIFSAFQKLFLARNGISFERAREFLEAGLTELTHIRDAVHYQLTAQDIRDYDPTFSPYQIYHFKRLRIPNRMAIQLTSRQIMLAMGGKAALPGLLANDAGIGGRGDYDGSPKGVVPIRTQFVNGVSLALKRFRAYKRLMKDGF